MPIILVWSGIASLKLACDAALVVGDDVAALALPGAGVSGGLGAVGAGPRGVDGGVGQSGGMFTGRIVGVPVEDPFVEPPRWKWVRRAHRPHRGVVQGGREHVAIVILYLNMTAWFLAHAVGAFPHLGEGYNSIEPLLVFCPEYLHLGA